jgi:hypothetical protein
MSSEKWKNARKTMHYGAWVHDGDAPRGCVVADISETGARLDVEEPEDVPECFTLFLGGHGQPRHYCRVVWRSDEQIGVQFETARSDQEKAARPTVAPAA